MRKIQKQKRLAEAASSSKVILDFTNDVDDQEMPETKTSEPDTDFNGNVSKEKSEFITVELPRKIVTPNVTAMLDRTQTSNREGMGLISAILKEGKTVDGKPVELSEFALSFNTIKRKRESNREVAKEQIIQEFNDNKPKNVALHWDGKLITNYSDEKCEFEAIVASGAPNYQEGKLLSVSKVKDKSGKKTSSGAAQVECLVEAI